MTEHEELLMLRSMVEKQNKLLAEKEAVIQEKNHVIQEKDNMIQEKEHLIQEKDDVLRKKEIRIENLTQALLHARKKMFGRSSEATQIEGQMSLFEDVQTLSEELLVEQKKIMVQPYKRKPRKAGVRAEMLAELPKEIEEYVIDSEETCDICGGRLKIIGKQIVRTEVEYIPAHLKVKQIVRQVAKCTECGTKNSIHPKDHFRKAAVPSPVLAHSIASPSLVAHIMYQKFGLGIPLNRLEKDFERIGLVLSRSVMAHWVIRCSQEWLAPVYERIRQRLVKCECLHMDETRIQVNKEAGRKAHTQSWMWGIQSGKNEDIKAMYFYYSTTRSGDIPKNLLQGFSGYLTTDAYDGYNKVEGIKRNLCWSHVRRYFIDSIPLDSNGKEIPGSKGEKGKDYIDLLFKIEKELADYDFEQKKEKRQVASQATLDAFWSWVTETSQMYTTNEKLTQALRYAQNHRQHLETFLEDGRLDISNNLCEAHIRPFATARRAWLFADTPKGATANAVLYTLVETAKQNDLDVYGYLCYLLASMPNVDFHNHPELVDDYLPWSASLPEECRLNNKKKSEPENKA